MGFEELRAQLEEVEESIKKFLQDAENEKRVLINKHELAKIAHDRRVSNLRRDQQIGSEAITAKAPSMEEVMRRERQKATRETQNDEAQQVHTWRKKAPHSISNMGEGTSKLIERMENMSKAQDREFEKKFSLLEAEQNQHQHDISAKLVEMMELFNVDPVSPSRKSRENLRLSHGNNSRLSLYPTAVRRAPDGCTRTSCTPAKTAEPQELAASNPFADHFEHQRQEIIHSQGRESLPPATALDAGGKGERERLEGVNAQVAQRVWRAVSVADRSSVRADQANVALVLYLHAAEHLLPPLVEMGLQAAMVAAVEHAAPSHPALAQQLQADWRMMRPILHRGCASIVRGARAKAEAGVLAGRFFAALGGESKGDVTREDFEDSLFDALAAIISPTAIVAVIQHSLGLPASEVLCSPLPQRRAQNNRQGCGGATEVDSLDGRGGGEGLGQEGMLWLEEEEDVEEAFTPRTRRVLYPQEDLL